MNPEELERKIKALENQLTFLIKNPTLLNHQHTGFDSDRIDWSDIASKKIVFPHTIIAADAATAANYTTFFTNRIAPGYISGFWEAHQAAGSDAGAVNLQLEKLTGTQAPDAGATMLSVGINLKETANTVISGTLTATLANRNLALGNRLCLRDSGTLTAVSNVNTFTELTIT